MTLSQQIMIVLSVLIKKYRSLESFSFRKNYVFSVRLFVPCCEYQEILIHDFLKPIFNERTSNNDQWHQDASPRCSFQVRLCISIRGRVRPSVRPSIRPSVRMSRVIFKQTNMAIFEGKKSSNDIIINVSICVTMKQSHLMYPRGTCFDNSL